MSSSQESNAVDNTETYQGVCKWFSNKKGYGFITITSDNNKGDDVFVHISAVQESGLGTLNDNDHINFEIVENRGKNAAANLTKVESSDE